MHIYYCIEYLFDTSFNTHLILVYYVLARFSSRRQSLRAATGSLEENVLPLLRYRLISMKFSIELSRRGPDDVKTVTKNEVKSQAECDQNRIASHFNRSSCTSSCYLLI